MFIHTFCLYMGGVERVKFTRRMQCIVGSRGGIMMYAVCVVHMCKSCCVFQFQSSGKHKSNLYIMQSDL